MKYYESPRASDGDKIHPTSLHSSGIVDTLFKHTLGSPSICEKHGIEFNQNCPPLAKSFLIPHRFFLRSRGLF